MIKRWPCPARPTPIMRKESSMSVGTEIKIKSQYEIPATSDVILAHLFMAVMHLPLKGVNRDTPDAGSQATALILKDYTQRLIAKKTTEVDLVIALEWFIENGKSEFFPVFSKLNRKIFGVSKNDIEEFDE